MEKCPRIFEKVWNILQNSRSAEIRCCHCDKVKGGFDSPVRTKCLPSIHFHVGVHAGRGTRGPWPSSAWKKPWGGQDGWYFAEELSKLWAQRVLCYYRKSQGWEVRRRQIPTWEFRNAYFLSHNLSSHRGTVERFQPRHARHDAGDRFCWRFLPAGELLWRSVWAGISILYLKLQTDISKFSVLPAFATVGWDHEVAI